MKVDLTLDVTEEELEQYLPMLEELADKYDPNEDPKKLRSRLLSDIYLLQIEGARNSTRELEIKYDFLIKLYHKVIEGENAHTER